MSDMYDVIIIGGGPGGYVSAIRCAQLGLKTAVIEKEHLGGICLNFGCIPSKAFLKSGRIARYVNDAEKYGIIFNDKSYKIDLQKIIKRSRDVIGRLGKGIEFLMKHNKIDVIKGHARFINAETVQVDNDKQYKAKKYVIATGGKPRVLPGFKTSTRVWTYKEAMLPTLESPPKRMLIIGSGSIGLEFASFYNALGTHVEVCEMMPRILMSQDDDISTVLQKILEKQGIVFRVNTITQEGKELDDGVEVSFNTGEKQIYDVVLMAAGVMPNTDDLGLDKTKIELNKSEIIVDIHSQTKEPNIFAIGDVVKGPWLAHKASHEGVMVAEYIKGLKPHPIDANRIPSCFYLHPEIASVGLTEKQALEKGYKLKIGKSHFASNGKALAEGNEDGLIKTIFDAATGELLGVHMLGDGVTEMIHSAVLCMNLEITEQELLETVFPHPSLSELIHESVLTAYGRGIHQV